MPHETQPDQIASDAQTTLDEIRRLQADRTHRDARRMFFVEGVRNVVHAIESGFQIETLLYSEKLLIVPIARRLIRERRRTGVRTIEVSPESFRQISLTPRASGVGAIVSQRWSSLHHASPKAGLCWVLLEAIQSEGNLGSLIRTSEAVGGAGFILTGPLIDPSSPTVVRASMGVSSASRSFGRTTVASGTGSVAIAVASSAPRQVGRPTSIVSAFPGRRSSSWAKGVRD